MDYRVKLDTFHGPLDLLLHLVRKNEVDIRDIPIATIAEQFQSYLRVLHVADVELAGDFLVMAATLMEIKSKMLLPQDRATPSEAGSETADDPRRELVKQLMEYKKFKEAAARLGERAGESLQRLPRGAPAAVDSPGGPPAVQAVELWDLVSAFGRILSETRALEANRIIEDDTPQAVWLDSVRRSLSAQPRLRFQELFSPPYYKARLVGLFLAILELIRNGEAILEQDSLFGDIWVRRKETPLPSPPDS
jgi:segregation and condensation protein A